jgi:hypothetical protein
VDNASCFNNSTEFYPSLANPDKYSIPLHAFNSGKFKAAIARGFAPPHPISQKTRGWFCGSSSDLILKTN